LRIGPMAFNISVKRFSCLQWCTWCLT
jgi:hypothetical protein